jgi:hypothetical protein
VAEDSLEELVKCDRRHIAFRDLLDLALDALSPPVSSVAQAGKERSKTAPCIKMVDDRINLREAEARIPSAGRE